MSKAAIVEFLLRRFSSDELRRLMSYNYAELTPALPGANASPAAVADACVELLMQREQIDGAFFELLRRERPRTTTEIDALERAHQAALASQTGIPPEKPATIMLASASPNESRQSMPRDVDFAVFTALPLETQAVLQQLSDTKERTLPATGTLLEIGELKGRHGSVTVAVAEAGVGNIAAARLAQEVYGALRPKAALFVGIAGGIKDVELGHVVVSTKIYAYESGKDGEQFSPRPQLGESSYRLLQRARADARRSSWLDRLTLAAGESPPEVHIGPIAAGEKVIASTRSSTYELLKTHYGDALAVEMEGFGFLQALYPYKAEALVVRGVSDKLDQKDVADKAGWQRRAARNAAAFALEVMANLDA